MLNQVREKGEVKSADFKRVGGKERRLVDWKPEKLALECLALWGS